MEKTWLAHYPPEIPHRLDYPNKTLPDYLRKTAAEFGGHDAIYFLGKTLTFREVYEQALTLANYLRQIGLKKGDRVSIMLPNCPQAVVSYYGVLLAGGIVVQTNPLYTEHELEYQLNDSGATVLITLDMLYPKAAKAKAKANVKHLIITSMKDYLPTVKKWLYPLMQRKQGQPAAVKVEERSDQHLFSKIMSRPNITEPNVAIDPVEDIALLQYTGGTTGVPKAAMLTHRNLIANTLMCAHWMYRCGKGTESILGILPFFHVYGMTTIMNLAIVQAYKMILLPRFDAETTLKMIEKLRPTLFPGAPTMYIALLNHPNLSQYDLSSIKVCISGSAPLPVEVQEKFEKVTGGKMIEGYGLTEASPVTHSNFVWDGERVKGSIGVPWPDTEAKIVSLETGEEAKVNEIGELVVRGPQVMKGYWNQPHETENVLRGGWLYTGDIGYMDERGYFYIVDRKKDIIIASGYNIYPREVEEVLYEHPKVQEAVVVGVPDKYRGETVKAFVVLKQGEQCTEEELDQFMRSRLASYKVPRMYEFRKELPKTAVGKILRRALLEEEMKKNNESV
ncbi:MULTISPECIES: long-chain-fatty-acid--CoA ligase [Parageobacillus]|jgi:long-chain acyl-CoA synthetase|uniref:Long-chain fatty acid--CoA ligase n=1 Tax=Parageobacillus thermoglucosidasius TaxID=1426 RepID=A0A1B7KW48_PARTM|nr:MULTISPECIES: long-chain-fatty-acid--CoA ligase [Parageobacillus]OAT74291.1 long-chain fatty acid--CoA ligase [Parageobacillus thermoglucosidasius]BDG46228.1 long-chain-fatty-acid--CoA ligase [Parageobacillus sp. KH3-4]